MVERRGGAKDETAALDLALHQHPRPPSARRPFPFTASAAAGLSRSAGGILAPEARALVIQSGSPIR
jgi:hypothetical protein